MFVFDLAQPMVWSLPKMGMIQVDRDDSAMDAGRKLDGACSYIVLCDLLKWIHQGVLV